MTLPVILPRAEHPISRGYIDPDALRVLYRLHRAGYKAFLVGGSVRDLMTGRTPKDFDIGTDAKPQEVRRLFRNSRVIGRRFRLVHILFEGGKVVEVATFRRKPEREETEAGPAADADLLIRSDNTFGTPEEDAERRDFTINGLFYDIATYAVVDFVGGVDDLRQGLVRTIGDPSLRFREDPVRMLRACEFAARLDFRMTPDLVDAMHDLRLEIRKSAPPRVTEELLDPLRRGWASGAYRLWSETGLLDALLPELEEAVGVHRAGRGEPPFRGLFWRMLAETDRRRATRDEPLPDAALLGVVFLPLLLGAVRRRAAGGERGLEAARTLLVLEEVVNPLATRLALPNLTTHLLKQSLYTMGRLTEVPPASPAARRLVGRPWLAPAVELLSLYAAASDRYRDPAAAWEEVVARGGRRPAGSAALAVTTPFPEALVPPPGAADGSFPPAETAARRPRRRRRRAAGRETR